MDKKQKSFAERLAQIEKDKRAAAPPVAPVTQDASDIPRPGPATVARALDRAWVAVAGLATCVVVVSIGFAVAFALSGTDGKLRILSLVSPGFGQVNSTDDSPQDRYEWDTKPTPFNASRLGMKRMNAFAQDMSIMEMNALMREAKSLGQPFLANEIAREMGACETLRCRSALKDHYTAHLKKLRKSTPTW